MSRRQVLRPRRVSLHEVVHEALALLQRALGEQVRLDVRLMAHDPYVVVDAEQVRTAVLDLALFARDMMPAGGVLSVETADAGDDVRLTMRDTGLGLAPDGVARLFEPYAAGPEGRRVGLGLSTVSGIVRQSGGRIEVESAPGEGTSFCVTLPLAREEVAEEPGPFDEEPADAEPASLPRRTSGPTARVDRPVVLLAEDETPLRLVVARHLERAGCQVIQARDGSEALQLASRMASSPDLVVTDVAMPGLGGPALVERLRERDPDVPVIYVSGYADDPESRRVLGAAAAYLQKPFALRSLLDAVERTLRARAGSRDGG